jgi:ribosome-binding protein aMBF1 (putative translation factor)
VTSKAEQFPPSFHLFTLTRNQQNMATSQSKALKWLPPQTKPTRKAKAIPLEVWEQYEDVLRDLRRKKAMTIAQIVQWMKENYGFVAT